MKYPIANTPASGAGLEFINGTALVLPTLSLGYVET